MRYAFWKDYELIDTSSGERLERWGDVILIRPDPQVIWDTPKTDARWHGSAAIYIRSSSGGGQWQINQELKDSWVISYQGLKFNVKMMNFKHTGVFPEQAVNWDWLKKAASGEQKQMNILNLFAYTGGATLACAKAGAKVCHVDAAKGMVSWARENAKISGLHSTSVRWIVDDCEKFVLREIKRGNTYDGIIMDPPSYGRGPKGEIWKIEDNLYSLIKQCERLLASDAKFFMVNSYSSGLSPAVMDYLLSKLIKEKRGGKVTSDEIGIPVSSSGLIMPAGATAIWNNKDFS